MAERDAAVIELIGASPQSGQAMVRLEFEIQGGCGRCNEPGGCGGVSLAQPLCSKPKTMIVLDPIGLSVGEKVRVSIPDQLLSRGVTHTYVISLLFFIGGSLLGTLLLPDILPAQWQVTRDVGAMIGAGVGLIAAWWQLQRSQRRAPMAAPRILERL